MIDVEIKNFQAIDDLKLEIEGFTALVGRTNIGKSSIVRALKTALAGGSGSDFVRHDARSCARILNGTKSCKCFSSVKVMFGEGQGFLWEKGGKGINRYTVWKDGAQAVYDRVGQNMDLPEVLGREFAPVKLGPEDTLLQVTSQFEAPFLLNMSGGAVADVLSDIGQLDDINQAMAAVSKDRRSAIATRKVREGDAEALGRQLEAYGALDLHLARVRSLREQGARVTETSGRVALIDRLLQEVTDASRSLRQIRAALEHPVPAAKPVQTAFDRLGKVRLLQDTWDRRVAGEAALKAALHPELPALESLTRVVARWRQVSTWQSAVLDRTRAVERLVALERVALPAEQSWAALGVLKRISGWLGALVELKTSFEKGARLQKVKVPDVAPIAALYKRLAEVDRLSSLHDRLGREIERSAQLTADCQEEVRGILAEFASLGVCPTCHQDISPEHVVACAED